MAINNDNRLRGDRVGDFIGFTFDGVHSSEFNLVRVSDGSRFENNLLPSFQDYTVQAEGKDGVYYFGTVFKERQIKFSTVFDELDENTYLKMIKKFSAKKISKLWFDEEPYKVYYVKLKTVPVIKKLCFDEGEGRERIYRGEMDLDFVCYPSYALARASYVDQKLPDEEFVIIKTGDPEKAPLVLHNHHLGESFQGIGFKKKYGKEGATLKESYNYNEWQKASGLLESSLGQESGENKEGQVEPIESDESGISFPIYNPGVKEADIILTYIPSLGETAANPVFPGVKLWFGEASGREKMGIKAFEFKPDETIVNDSKKHMIYGINSNGNINIYNKYHISGDFFHIPCLPEEEKITLEITQNSGGEQTQGTWKVEYNFYYM